jgi:hypothetical protein
VNNAKCIGPNGPGTQEECEGQKPPPGPPGDGGGGGSDAGRTVDSCDGRADGTYCSVISPNSAIMCKGNSIAGGQQCPSGKLCSGPNGPGAQIVCN